MTQLKITIRDLRIQQLFHLDWRVEISQYYDDNLERKIYWRIWNRVLKKYVETAENTVATFNSEDEAWDALIEAIFGKEIKADSPEEIYNNYPDMGKMA